MEEYPHHERPASKTKNDIFQNLKLSPTKPVMQQWKKDHQYEPASFQQLGE